MTRARGVYNHALPPDCGRSFPTWWSGILLQAAAAESISAMVFTSSTIRMSSFSVVQKRLAWIISSRRRASRLERAVFFFEEISVFMDVQGFFTTSTHDKQALSRG